MARFFSPAIKANSIRILNAMGDLAKELGYT